MFASLLKKVFFGGSADPWQSPKWVADQHDLAKEQFHSTIAKLGMPRIAVVKQDINEDLYCCPSGSKGRTVVESTLLRSGPAALFSECDATFVMVKTVDDAECSVWQERATKLNWDTLEFFRSYQTRIPGRDYGQGKFSVAVDDVDWSAFDIVVSIDNSVPQRVTQQFPQVLWAYYVREIKTPEYKQSLERPLPGQDVVLNHHFRPVPKPSADHVLDFPYHLHLVGCLPSLLETEIVSDPERSGVFVDHHTMIAVTAEQRVELAQFGPIASTIHEGSREVIPTSEKLARRTLDPDLRERLFASRFFLCSAGHRQVFGTALVEAIAAGELVIGSPQNIVCSFLLSEATSADSFSEAIAKMQLLSNDEAVYGREIQRQRQLVDWLCFYRPLQQLMNRWQQKT
ncbi:MAG: hypothetical protein KDA88_12420 [Planctomycetaceae bacterium]|nr:hypothetical protein [Planctomycetaceae bacterium]MCB9952033.1 hypothetical protein [Planctomycetaceae bacterium]